MHKGNFWLLSSRICMHGHLAIPRVTAHVSSRAGRMILISCRSVPEEALASVHPQALNVALSFPLLELMYFIHGIHQYHCRKAVFYMLLWLMIVWRVLFWNLLLWAVGWILMVIQFQISLRYRVLPSCWKWSCWQWNWWESKNQMKEQRLIIQGITHFSCSCMQLGLAVNQTTYVTLGYKHVTLNQIQSLIPWKNSFSQES